MRHDRRRAPWLASVTLALGAVGAASVRPAMAEPAATAESTPAQAPAGIAAPVEVEQERAPESAPMLPEARAHFEEGLRLYGDHSFPAAIQEFEAGFALDPRREFLFAEAQAYRLAGDCARALPLYERFLGSGPSALHADATRLALERCARQAPAVVPAPAAAPQASAPIVATPAPRTERAWWRDPWALSALGAGAIAAGVGSGFVIAAYRARDQANASSTTLHADYDRLWSAAEQRRAIGVVSLSAGAALAIAGAIRLGVLRHRESAARPPRAPSLLSLAPSLEGATLLWQVTY